MVFEKHHPLVFKGFAATVPLGLAYIAAYLERSGHQVHVIDFQIGNFDIADEIRTFKPNMLGLSICSPALPHAKEIAAIARKTDPNLAIIAGGPHVSFFREAMFKEIPELDLIVPGEGELVTTNLADRLSKNGVLDVPGVIYRQGTEFVSTGVEPQVEDLSNLPMLPLHLFNVRKYYPLPGNFRQLPSIAMSTSRGCPYQCTFCNKGIWTHKARVRPPLSVVDDIEAAVRKYHAREVYFVDELFTMKRANVVTFCESFCVGIYGSDGSAVRGWIP